MTRPSKSSAGSVRCACGAPASAGHEINGVYSCAACWTEHAIEQAPPPPRRDRAAQYEARIKSMTRTRSNARHARRTVLEEMLPGESATLAGVKVMKTSTSSWSVIDDERARQGFEPEVFQSDDIEEFLNEAWPKE